MPKKIIYIIVFCFIAFTQMYGKFGYRSRTIGLLGGTDYYFTSPLYSAGIYFDRFHKNCLSGRTYESISVEYGFRRKEYNYNSVSIKLSKGITKPILISRTTCLHPSASLNTLYTINNSPNKLTLRPELGFVLTGPVVKPITTRFSIFYGYNFALMKDQNNKLSEHYIGIKFIFGLDLSKLKKHTLAEPEKTE